MDGRAHDGLRSNGGHERRRGSGDGAGGASRRRRNRSGSRSRSRSRGTATQRRSDETWEFPNPQNANMGINDNVNDNVNDNSRVRMEVNTRDRPSFVDGDEIDATTFATNPTARSSVRFMDFDTIADSTAAGGASMSRAPSMGGDTATSASAAAQERIRPSRLRRSQSSRDSSRQTDRAPSSPYSSARPSAAPRNSTASLRRRLLRSTGGSGSGFDPVTTSASGEFDAPFQRPSDFSNVSHQRYDEILQAITREDSGRQLRTVDLGQSNSTSPNQRYSFNSGDGVAPHAINNIQFIDDAADTATMVTELTMRSSVGFVDAEVLAALSVVELANQNGSFTPLRRSHSSGEVDRRRSRQLSSSSSSFHPRTRNHSFSTAGASTVVSNSSTSRRAMLRRSGSLDGGRSVNTARSNQSRRRLAEMRRHSDHGNASHQRYYEILQAVTREDSGRQLRSIDLDMGDGDNHNHNFDDNYDDEDAKAKKSQAKDEKDSKARSIFPQDRDDMLKQDGTEVIVTKDGVVRVPSSKDQDSQAPRNRAARRARDHPALPGAMRVSNDTEIPTSLIPYEDADMISVTEDLIMNDTARDFPERRGAGIIRLGRDFADFDVESHSEAPTVSITASRQSQGQQEQEQEQTLSMDASGTQDVALTAELAVSHDELRQNFRAEVKKEYESRLAQELRQRTQAGAAIDPAVVLATATAVVDAEGASGADGATPSDAMLRKHQQEVARTRRLTIMAVIFVIVVAAVGVIVFLVVGGGGSNSSGGGADGSNTAGLEPAQPSAQPSAQPTSQPTITSQPTSAPTITPSSFPTMYILQFEAFTQIRDIIGPTLRGPPAFLDDSVWTDQNSTTFKIAEWMTLSDQSTQDSLDTNLPGISRFLLERYALLDMYLSMNGPNWFLRAGFMTGVDHCDWFDDANEIGVECDLGTVTAVKLSTNNVAGSLPDSFYFLNLRQLEIDVSDITGTISSHISDMSRLQEIRVTGARLTGVIPSEIGLLQNLKGLRMRDHGLVGPIPSEIGDCQRLTTLDVGKNALSGMMPSEIGRLESLATLQIDRNGIEGTLPIHLTQLGQLQTFHLIFTNITGNLDPMFCTADFNWEASYQQFTSDCESDVFPIPGAALATPPKVICSCCSLCCTSTTNVCFGQDPQFIGCNGQCIACGGGFYRTSCEECPEDGNSRSEIFVPACERACKKNMETGVCEPRTELYFDWLERNS